MERENKLLFGGMAVFLLAIILSLIALSCAEGATLQLTLLAPTVNADNGNYCGYEFDTLAVEVDPMLHVVLGATPITDLKEIVIFGKRFVDTDTLILGVIPVLPTGGDTIRVALAILDGSMGTVWGLARDFSGNFSCKGFEKLFAFPLTQEALVNTAIIEMEELKLMLPLSNLTTSKVDNWIRLIKESP